MKRSAEARKQELAAEASHRELLAALAALPAEEVAWDHGVRSAGGRRVTVEMLLGVEARDERRHAEQIRAFAARRAGV